MKFADFLHLVEEGILPTSLTTASDSALYIREEDGYEEEEDWFHYGPGFEDDWDSGDWNTDGDWNTNDQGNNNSMGNDGWKPQTLAQGQQIWLLRFWNHTARF